MNYIRRHWEGQLPLVTAFWVNVFLINVAIRILETWLDQSSPIEHPVTASQVAVIFFLLAVFVVYPWQVVGVWRSADRYSKEPNSGIWGGAVRIVVVLGMLGTVSNLVISLPVYSDLFKIGFGQDEYSDYELSVTDDGSLIHLKGGLGFGVSDDFAAFVAKNDSVTGVILDSRGGRIFEGRQLANIILANVLDTYSLAGCYSACGTAFIAGNRRYLSTGANLAFHQYTMPGDTIGLYFDIGTEQEKDLRIYRGKGISEDFIERIFLADQDDLWYPTADELLASGVVHEFVNPSDLQVADYGEFESGDFQEEIARYAAFQTIKAYEPETYSSLIADIELQLRAGASRLEVQQTVAGYVESLATKSFPQTSNRALVEFSAETIKILDKLEQRDPILCLKNLFPAQYGSLEVMNYLTVEDMLPMMDALGLVISDRYESPKSTVDMAAAETLFAEIFEEMGDDALYLDSPLLENSEDYSKACRAVIRFYELILTYDEETAGNGLRYAYSP